MANNRLNKIFIESKRAIVKNIITIAMGSIILAFGIFNIHSFSGVTEGGALGLMLLLEHHFGISPAVSGIVINFLCYLFGLGILGKSFIAYSAVSGIVFSAAYGVFEFIGPVFPQIGSFPLAASVAGAVFVGIGCGLCVRAGAATSGDDALSMAISKVSGIGIQWIYLASDLAVLILSLTYIPVTRIAYSLLTVIISGQLVGLVSRKKQRKD